MVTNTPDKLLDKAAKQEIASRGLRPTAENLNMMKQHLATNRRDLSSAVNNSGEEQRTAGRTTSGVELAQVKAPKDTFDKTLDKGLDDDPITWNSERIEPNTQAIPTEQAMSSPNATTPTNALSLESEFGDIVANAGGDSDYMAELLGGAGALLGAAVVKKLMSGQKDYTAKTRTATPFENPDYMAEKFSNPTEKDIFAQLEHNDTSTKYTGPKMIEGGQADEGNARLSPTQPKLGGPSGAASQLPMPEQSNAWQDMMLGMMNDADAERIPASPNMNGYQGSNSINIPPQDQMMLQDAFIKQGVPVEQMPRDPRVVQDLIRLMRVM